MQPAPSPLVMIRPLHCWLTGNRPTGLVAEPERSEEWMKGRLRPPHGSALACGTTYENDTLAGGEPGSLVGTLKVRAAEEPDVPPESLQASVAPPEVRRRRTKTGT